MKNVLFATLFSTMFFMAGSLSADHAINNEGQAVGLDERSANQMPGDLNLDEANADSFYGYGYGYPYYSYYYPYYYGYGSYYPYYYGYNSYYPYYNGYGSYYPYYTSYYYTLPTHKKTTITIRKRPAAMMNMNDNGDNDDFGDESDDGDMMDK